MGRVQRAARWLLTVGQDKEQLGPTRRLALTQYALGWKATPAEDIKRRNLRKIFRERGHDTLVESGTYLGDTVALIEPEARLIVSVELHEGLYKRARQRFVDNPKVELHKGDATQVIPEVVERIDGTPLIWLDGHYSREGTARGDEIEPALTLLKQLGAMTKAGTTIVVDDLRQFGSHEEYPELETLLAVARQAYPDAKIHTGLDSLVIET